MKSLRKKNRKKRTSRNTIDRAMQLIKKDKESNSNQPSPGRTPGRA